MQYFGLIIIFVIIHESLSSSLNETDSFPLLKSNSSTEQKGWIINLDIYFAKPLPIVLHRSPGTEVRFKCEAIMNFTKVEKFTKNKEGVKTSLKQIPPDHIYETLMKNIKVYWLKNNKVLSDNSTIKIFTKIDKTNGTITTNLRLRHLNINDAGNYTCVFKQNYEKRLSTRLIVEEDSESFDTLDASLSSSVLPSVKTDDVFTADVKTTPNLMSEGMTIELVNNVSNKDFVTKKLEPICQEYFGKVCSPHLKGQFVYIPYHTSQVALENKLMKAFQVTKYSNDISSHCEGYARPSLCYSTFPICRNSTFTNENFLKEARKIFKLDDKDELKINYDDMTQNILIPSEINNTYEKLFNFRYNSTVLRRVCKQDCEILENELCQTEYAIAKRHPHIGQQLTLEECQDLPEDDPECLKIGIGTLMVSDDECYWENGSGYLGKVNVTSSGMPCIEWSKQLSLKVSDYPELAGRHSYCRNPGGMKTQPWCFVDNDGRTDQLCDIPKCAHKIWIYIFAVVFLVTVLIVGISNWLFYRSHMKGNAATIRDINLPNADKNIYGNSRLNSPIEMNELLNNQNNGSQPHLSSTSRGNGILRIPQYSLSQIKFLEELGEGAFGKVYKGALQKNGETQYVAVKALKENASAKTKADFRREIDLISELTHDNIVCIVGVALREEPLCMLFEFMARGDLHEFLMGRAPPSGKGLPLTRLLNIAHNIASGMQYLASHHYVHRDLAARNCLVSDDFIVKISDFGLSRDIYSSDYYRVQSKSLLPVRWMPPESILYGKFTTESDIWSYGVVLWEIYSYGLQPYYGYSNQEVIAMVRAGDLLAAPAGCPAAMYALMKECWKHTPQRRPNFEEIVMRIQEWIQAGGCPDVAPPAPREAERAPLLPAHCSLSNGSLATNSLRKLATPGSSRNADDNFSTCSDLPPLAPKTKKYSSGSLIDTDKIGTRETVVRIPNKHFGNDI